MSIPETMEAKSSRESELHSDTAESLCDQTAVATPERVDSRSDEKTVDIEKAIARQKDVSPVPVEAAEGGLKGWLTVFGSWCILFSTFGMTSAFGVYQDYYVRVFLTAYSPSAIGWIGSTQLFFQFSMGIFAGRLFDAGYFYYLVTLGSLLYLTAYYMLSLAQPNAFYQVFLTQGVAAGLAQGFLFLPAVSVIAHHFKRRRSFAMGMVITGSSCGGLVFPIMLNRLIAAGGFAQATRAVAFLCTGLMLLAVLLMRTRIPPPSKATTSQEKSDIEVQEKPVPVPVATTKDLLKDKRYMITVVGSFFNMLGLFTPIFYIQLYAVAHGLDRSLVFYTVTILNGASVIGRVIPNLVGDHWGLFNAIIACTGACTVLIFAMLGATDAAGIIVICVLYGLFSGAYVSLINPLLASLANNVSEIGIRLGLCYTIIAFASLAGTPIAGALLTQNLIWARPLAFSGACMFISFVCLFAARHLTVRSKGTWKV